MAESTASLRAEIKALSGVDIMLNENTFKSTYQIMDELSKKWKDLSDISQATIIELVAGKHQGNVFASLMSNFDTARNALTTSLESSGSAMKEHEKWSQSLEARLNKLKAAWQGLSQAFMKSDFLKTVLNAVTGLVDGLTKLIDTLGALPTLLGVFAGYKGISAITKNLPTLIRVFQLFGRLNAKGLLNIANVTRVLGILFPKATAGAKTFGAAIKAMFTAMTAHPIILAITAAIGALTWAFSHQQKKAKELAEKVEELTDKYRQQHEELRKLKGDYDTSNESSMISKYEKLSKGVDNLGRNVSLTSEEYSEYQSIVNSIADQIPSLVSGYDSQGNAILSVKGNVEELTKAYEKLIHAQNNEVLTNAGNIAKDFENTINKSEFRFWEGIWERTPVVNWFTSDDLNTDTVENLSRLLNGEVNIDDIVNLSADNDNGDYIDGRQLDEIRKALKDAGVEMSDWVDGTPKVLEDVLKNNPEKIKGIIDDYYAQFDEAVEKKKTIAQAKLSEAFDISSVISGLNYGNISEDLQAIARQTVNSLDLEFFKGLQEDGKTVEQWTTEMLNQLNSISKDDNAKIEAAFDLQTQFNGGEISYGEYVDGLKDTGELIKGLDLDDKVESQLLLSLGLNEKGLVEEYQQLRNRLADDELFDISASEYEPFLKGLSSEELSVLVDIIPELSETDYKENIADIKAALEKEMMLQGLTFDLNLEVEATGLEALNTALSESVSATGLSSESISALKGRYADLESQGYDLSSMFEETSTGIRLNRQELNKLEKAYATEKLAEVDGELAEMKSAYDDLGEAIKNCDDPIKKSELFNDRQTLAKRIGEAATLASQYEGLTNAYNDWLSAEEAGQERDMYENIIKGFETVDDEISRGWIDDGAIEFLELLTGRTDLAGKSGKQLKEIYDGLDKSIKYLGEDGKVLENTGYSVRDFFTVDEDGNSTNTGVYNFLDAIGKLEEEAFGGANVVDRKDGNIIGFNFGLVAKKDENGNIIKNGDQVIAEALGISEELVQIMVRAADDAGFVISMDGTYRQLADLQSEAKAAADYLHEIGKTDFEFDFNTTSVENLKTQLEEAHKILDDKKFWNKDGTFDFDADGATQAMQVVSTLQAKLDNLTSEKYGIGLTVEDEEFEEPLENLQNYGRTIHTLNQLRLNPEVNADEIEELEGNLEEIAKYFAGLDGEKKVEIGLVTENGKTAFTEEYFNSLSKEKKMEIGLVNDKGEPLTDYIDAVQKKIESGEVEIPTVLDIQTNMDKNLETLADLALLDSGLLSESEEKVIRQKYNIEIEADEVDTSDVDDKVDNAIHVGSDGKFTLSREANVEIIAKTFGVDDIDDLSSKLEGLDDKTVEAVAKAVGKIQVDELKKAVALLKPNEVEAIAKAIGKGDVVELSDIIGQLSPKTVDAIANALGYDDVNDLRIAVENLDPKTVEAVANAFGITDVESLKGAVDSLTDNDVYATAHVSGKSDVDSLNSSIDTLKGKDGTKITIKSVLQTVKETIFKTGSTRNDSNGFNEVNGTANVNGTTGRAFKQGSWGTKNSGTALMGELGRKILRPYIVICIKKSI